MVNDISISNMGGDLMCQMYKNLSKNAAILLENVYEIHYQ